MGVTPPPYRIETERLVVRCWDPHDAPRLKEAVDSSIDHLRPWMPWAADEPQTLEQKIDLLRRFRGQFDLGEDFVYGILSRDEARVIGGSGLHTRVGPGAFEIGYWIRADATGQGYATEVTATLTRVAFDLCEADRVEIRVDPRNGRSAAVPRRLGFVEEATLRRRLPPIEPSTEQGDVGVYTMFEADFAASPCAGASYAAFDAAGREMSR